jgi:hypothetical protein
MLLHILFIGGVFLIIKHTDIINIIDEKSIPIFQALVYNIIYAFSLCQIKYNQASRILFPSNTRENETVQKYQVNKVVLNAMFYNNSLLIKNLECCIEKQGINIVIKNEEPMNYNLMIVSRFINNTDRKMMINYTNSHSLNNNNEIKDFNNIYNCQETEYKFVAINLIYNEKSYQIQLITDAYNFYIVDNIIDNIFLHYYLTTMLKVPTENINKFTYKLEIMDHNINMFSLTDTNYIILKKNDYTVFEKDTMRETLYNEKVEDVEKENVEEEDVEEELGNFCRY